MTTPPFRRMVEAALLLGYRFPAIIQQLLEFDFHCVEEDLALILQEMRGIIGAKEKLDSCTRFDLVSDRSWYDVFDAFEFADYYLNHKNKDEPYFKWWRDCYWILHNRDVATLVHIFMFNGDTDESISDFVSVKFRKKIGIEALSKYRKTFWDTGHLDAKAACYFYKKFNDNAVIIRSRSNGETEIESNSILSGNDGLDEGVVFNDTNYIKWKLGYRKIDIPSAADFVKRVMQDSYYKYQEAMAMTRSVEEVDESGSNDELGSFSSERTTRRNVEEQRIKNARAWMEMYFKAAAHTRAQTSDEEEFFKRMAEISIKFDEEKIVAVTDVPNLLNDVKGDM